MAGIFVGLLLPSAMILSDAVYTSSKQTSEDNNSSSGDSWSLYFGDQNSKSGKKHENRSFFGQATLRACISARDYQKMVSLGKNNCNLWNNHRLKGL